MDRGTNENPGSESKGGRQKLHLGPPYKTNMSSPGPGLWLERPKARGTFILSPSTPIKSPAGCAIIWNKELDSLTLYKEQDSLTRSASSWGVLVGVLETSSFLPGLFLGHAAGAVRQKANPPSSKIAAKCHC
jgi:hypothetical protein